VGDDWTCCRDKFSAKERVSRPAVEMLPA
jgi:hypothetical protein